MAEEAVKSEVSLVGLSCWVWDEVRPELESEAWGDEVILDKAAVPTILETPFSWVVCIEVAVVLYCEG